MTCQSVVRNWSDKGSARVEFCVWSQLMAKKQSPVDVHVAKNIRVFRIAKDLSQSALGEQLGVAFQQVKKNEKGRNPAADRRGDVGDKDFLKPTARKSRHAPPRPSVGPGFNRIPSCFRPSRRAISPRGAYRPDMCNGSTSGCRLRFGLSSVCVDDARVSGRSRHHRRQSSHRRRRDQIIFPRRRTFHRRRPRRGGEGYVRQPRF